MSDAFIGSIILFAGTFAPRGYAFCNGQTMSIAQNSALYAILGTTYGGNGTSTFNLPDLRGRVPVHYGNANATGIQTYQLGQMTGANSVTLQAANLPAHAHPFALGVSSAPADQTSPVNAIPAVPAASSGGRVPPSPTYAYTQTAATGTGATQNTGVTGSAQPASIVQPLLGLNFIICLQGIFPSRN